MCNQLYSVILAFEYNCGLQDWVFHTYQTIDPPKKFPNSYAMGA